DHPVGYSTDEVSHRCVLAVLAPAADDIEAFVELCQKIGNVLGIVLQIRIYRYDDAAARVVDTRHDRGGLPVIAAEGAKLDLRMKRRLLPPLGERAIAATVIYGDDFKPFLEVRRGV